MKKGDLLCFLQTILQDELIAQIELQDNLLTVCFPGGTFRTIVVL